MLYNVIHVLILTVTLMIIMMMAVIVMMICLIIIIIIVLSSHSLYVQVNFEYYLVPRSKNVQLCSSVKTNQITQEYKMNAI